MLLPKDIHVQHVPEQFQAYLLPANNAVLVRSAFFVLQLKYAVFVELFGELKFLPELVRINNFAALDLQVLVFGDGPK